MDWASDRFVITNFYNLSRTPGHIERSGWFRGYQFLYSFSILGAVILSGCIMQCKPLVNANRCNNSKD